MKENTKFLWMYVAILFSFAIILIVFAGLSRNFDEKETTGLENNVILVTEENRTLKSENKDLKDKLDKQIAENSARVAVDDMLFSVVQASDEGDFEKANQILEGINPETLTESQKYIYNRVIQENAD